MAKTTVAYIIFKSGDKTKAVSALNGRVVYEDMDAGAVFQSSINSISQGELYVKAGTYEISHPIRIKSNITITGEGKETTVLKLAADVNDFIVKTDADAVQSIRIAKLKLDGNKAVNTSGGGGISLFNPRLCVFSELWVTWCKQYGIQFAGDSAFGYQNIIENSVLDACDGDSINISNSDEHIIRNCAISFNNTGIRDLSGAQSIMNNTFVSNTNAIRVNDIGSDRIVGNIFDSNIQHSLILWNSQKNIVSNNQFYNTGAGYDDINNEYSGKDNVISDNVFNSPSARYNINATGNAAGDMDRVKISGNSFIASTSGAINKSNGTVTVMSNTGVSGQGSQNFVEHNANDVHSASQPSSWNQVTGKPSTFPPSSHNNSAHSVAYQSASDVDGKVEYHRANATHAANQPAQTHDNGRHSVAYQSASDVDGKVEYHRANATHAANQPAQTHDNGRHSTPYVIRAGDTMTGGLTAPSFYSQGEIGLANDTVIKFGLNRALRGVGNTIRINPNLDNTLIVLNGHTVIGDITTSYLLELELDSATKPGTNTWTISSDERLKKYVRPFMDGLSTILKIQPRLYRYNGRGGFTDDGKDKIGVIGQEIEPIAPYTTNRYMGKIYPSDVEETELLNFNSHALTFVLINAVKELSAEIETLKKQAGKKKKSRPKKRKLASQDA